MTSFLSASVFSTFDPRRLMASANSSTDSCGCCLREINSSISLHPPALSGEYLERKAFFKFAKFPFVSSARESNQSMAAFFIYSGNVVMICSSFKPFALVQISKRRNQSDASPLSSGSKRSNRTFSICSWRRCCLVNTDTMNSGEKNLDRRR